MRTKYLFDFFKIRDTFGYQLFIARQDTSQRPWAYLAWISKYLSLWLGLLMISCFSLSLGMVATYFKATYLWTWVVPNVLFTSLFCFCYWLFQKKGNQIYHQFMEAVEQRHQIEKNTQIASENTKILEQYLFKLQSTWLKITALLMLLPVLAFSIHHYQLKQQSKILSSKPSHTLHQLILQKKTKTLLWQQYIKNTQLRIKAAQKQYVKAYTQLKQAEAAIQIQLSALMQSQTQRRNIDVFWQSLSKAPNLAVKEQLIKTDAMIYAQAKGALEAQLALKDQDESQAAELLTQEGKLYEALQNLLSKQDYSISKAQKALSQERIQKEILEKEFLNAKKVLSNLLLLEDQYCHQKQKFEQDLVQFNKKYQQQLAKEKHY